MAWWLRWLSWPLRVWEIKLAIRDLHLRMGELWGKTYWPRRQHEIKLLKLAQQQQDMERDIRRIIAILDAAKREGV